MALYQFECSCGWSGDVDLPMSLPDHSKHPCQCGKTATRVYQSPKLLLFGGTGDSFRLPETLDEEQKLYQKKALDERTPLDYDLTGYEWKPGKNVPERFQPK